MPVVTDFEAARALKDATRELKSATRALKHATKEYYRASEAYSEKSVTRNSSYDANSIFAGEESTEQAYDVYADDKSSDEPEQERGRRRRFSATGVLVESSRTVDGFGVELRPRARSFEDLDRNNWWH